MKRVKILILLMLLVLGSASAQTVSSVTIGTSITTGPGPTFYVDGTAYNSPQIFLWPQGSKHIIYFPEDLDPITQVPLGYQSSGYPYFVRWGFSGWADNQGLLLPGGQQTQTITADPSITSFLAGVSVQYLLTINYSSAPGVDPGCFGAPGDAPLDAPRQGIFYVNGTCYDEGHQIWVSAGPVTLNAFPYPGFAFAGWTVNGQGLDPYLAQFNLTASTIVTPSFVAAKRVMFRTNPLGLSVVVDHSIVATPQNNGSTYTDANTCTPSASAISGAAPYGYTPLCTGDFDFVPGSSHQIAASTPQQDAQGNYWVFSGFSNGAGQNGAYVTDNNVSNPDTVYANFNPGVQVGIFTLPGGLPVLVDGAAVNTTGFYVWNPGETHQVTAPPTLADSKGNVYSFVRWSNNGPADQTITAPSDGSKFLLWASYQLEGQTQITTNPPGISITVNGSACTTPCIVNALGGVQVSASVPASASGGAGTRYDFDSWSTGSTSTSLQTTTTGGLLVISANYHTSYLLVTGVNPAGAATLVVSPSSRDGYYAAGTAVTVTATAKTNYNFWHWTGDYLGSTTVAHLNMGSPLSVSATLVQMNVNPPAAIINAAGPTPDGTIAPGSLISIYGQNMAAAPLVGRANPLDQTLGGVSVTVGNAIFPLLFVSPGQINAQVPWELAPGNYTLTVHWTGQPDVTGPITVSKNAPGAYYTQVTGQQPQAVAVHQDWTLVTPSSPARRNEYVTIYVNGMGPLDHTAIDGFPAPVDPLFAQTDAVTINVNGSIAVKPYWAGASPGTTGTGVVIVQIVDPIPAATTVNLTISVGGKTSTSVQLPVQ